MTAGSDVTYNDCMDVIDSWQRVKTMKDYERVLGHEVFSMFIDIEPESKVSLQIGQDDIDSDSTRYQYLAKTYFDMLDLAIDMLGPDLDILIDDLEDLGRRHGSFGVKPPFFHTLGEATFAGLKVCAGQDMAEETMESWKRVYGFLEVNMVKGCECYWKHH